MSEKITATANAIKLLIQLQRNFHNGIYIKAESLGETLGGLDKRCIQNLVKLLKNADIPIETKSGVNGGYRLSERVFRYIPQLEEKEYMALDIVENLMKTSGDFLDLCDYSSAVGKILASKPFDQYKSNIDHYLKYKSIKNDIDINQREQLELIKDSIVNFEQLIIKYDSLKNEVTERLIDPLYVIYSKGAYYIIAYCNSAKDLRTFKFVRIKEVERAGSKYSMQIGDLEVEKEIKQCINNAWNITTGELVCVKLVFSGVSARLVNEKTWNINESKYMKNRDQLEYSIKVRGIEEIKYWVMSFGSEVKVIQPISLKEKVIEEAKKILSYY